MDMDLREDLVYLHVRELRGEADALRLARAARAARAATPWSRRRSLLRTAVGTGLVRAGLRLGGKPPVGASSGPVRMAGPLGPVPGPGLRRSGR